MQTATGWLKISDLGDIVRVSNITPAEAVILRAQFGIRIEGESRPLSPITHLHIADDEIARTQHEEYQRLNRKYGADVMKATFPGENPNIPLKFADVGFEQTEETEPKKGKAPEILPLEKLPVGDNGADLVTGAEEAQAKLEAENMQLRLQLLEQKAASASAETIKAPIPPVVPPVASEDDED